MAKSEIEQLIDVMINVGIEVKNLNKNFNNLSAEVKGMRHDMDKRLESVEKQQQRTNLSIMELRTSIIKLNDDKKRVDKIDARVLRLEKKLL